MANSKPKPAKDPETGRFLTGNIGGGRKKGSRNELGAEFISALQDDFIENGVAAIQTVRAEKPEAYLRVIASVIPAELNVNVNRDLTDADLDFRIRQLATALDLEGGIVGASDGEAKASRH